MILRSELPPTEIEFIADPDELSTVETSTFQDKQEWSMYKHVEVRRLALKCDLVVNKSWFVAFQVSTQLPEVDDDDNQEENPFLNIPIITATARVARRSTFFFWNAILIMVTFAAPPTYSITKQ